LFAPLCVVLAAAAGNEVTFKAASAGLSVTGVPADRAEFYSEYVAQQLVAGGLKVVTPKEVASLLGMERQRQLLGCSDQGSCIAEIASALGADGVVQGEVARLENGGYQVSLKVVWSRDARPLALFSGRAIDEPGLLDVMGKGASLIAKDLTSDWTKLIQAPATHSIVPKSSGTLVTWVPGIVGVVSLAVGIGTFVRAKTIASSLSTGTFLSEAEARAVASEGATLQTMSIVLWAVAAAGLATTAVFWFLGSTSDVKTQFALTPDGASFGLTGVWP
jgi:hypothetical protein